MFLIIWKRPNWFAEQISWLLSIWWRTLIGYGNISRNKPYFHWCFFLHQNNFYYAGAKEIIKTSVIIKKYKDLTLVLLGIIGNCFKDRCNREAILESNGTLLSDDSRYKLSLKENRGLDIYCAAQYILSSNAANSIATKLHFQNDGALVIYTESRSPVWATHTTEIGTGKISNKVVLHDDGNLMMHFSNNQVKWSSGSNLVCQNGGSHIIYFVIRNFYINSHKSTFSWSYSSALGFFSMTVKSKR